jgi:integrase
LGHYQPLSLPEKRSLERPVWEESGHPNGHNQGSSHKKKESIMFHRSSSNAPRVPWNKGKLMGQKLPLSMQEIWSIRLRLQNIGNRRDLALFNLAIDSKLRACDLLSLRVSDVASGKEAQSRAIIRQKKTKRPVRFEVTARTRKSVEEWIQAAKLTENAFLFPSRLRSSPHLSLRQYARIVESWVSAIGLDPTAYGTHSMRRTKATLIYRRTKNLRAVQLLLGHTNLDSTVRYLGIEIDDALEMSEQIDV